MQDLFPYGKAAFWILLVAFLSLAMVPSIVLVQTAKQYLRFLTLWDPGTIQAMRIHHLPNHGLPITDSDTPQVYFAEFRIHAPKAHDVLLAGDFNRWKPETLPMVHSRIRGDWEILVPLPPGKYQYLFKVDGSWMTDSKSQISGSWNGHKTSVKQVP